MIRAVNRTWSYVALALFVFSVVRAFGQAEKPDPEEEAKASYAKGEYAEAAAKAAEVVEKHEWKESFHVLRMRALLKLGKYEEALKAAELGLAKASRGVRVRLAAREVFRFNGLEERADKIPEEINLLAGSRAWAYRNAPDLVALGRTALELGGDPKLVLDNLYKAARERDADYPEVPKAIGELALSKSDYELAGRTYQQALKKDPENADFHFGVARSFAPSEPEVTFLHLAAALDLNPHHAPSRLLLADLFINRESYEEAEAELAKVLKVNPRHPEAWARRAVLAHLQGDPKGEREARGKALAHWKKNPQVDYLIGKKLSERYRFAEGAAYQRRALAFDARFVPARIQLAGDLLRLGMEEEGWNLAAAVHEADGFDVATFNLLALKDVLDKYVTIRSDRFVLRMAPHEAAVYGKRALRLLERAHEVLTEKYGLKLERPTVVEIFEKQKDFGVRTFGMPENPGFLGVCFGCLITANSPATQAVGAANWEAVLWHEFCHTVTLAITRNKMPRWLSEGISVYEEREQDPTWGQGMNPDYRERILSGRMTPVGKMSAAFLTASSGEDLQFAYYQSSLVVEHLVERFGSEAITKVLRQLGAGVEINVALAEAAEPLEKLEASFASFARKKALAFGEGLDWSRPGEPTPLLLELPGDLNVTVARLDANATAGSPDANVSTTRAGEGNASASAPGPNFYALMEEAARFLEEERWEEAKKAAEALVRLCPEFVDAEPNPYLLLARARRELGEFEEERKTLEALAGRSSDSYGSYLRLMELAEEAGDWSEVRRNAERALAVNPMAPQPYRLRALAAEAEGEPDGAADSWRTLLKLEPDDLAEAHYRLAKLLRVRDRPEEKASAKRHLLLALEAAPRFREAHRLLREWKEEQEHEK